MTLHVFNDIEQGTDAWMDARRGVLTASVVGKLLTLEAPSAGTVDCPKCKAVAGSPCLSLARKEPTPIATYHPERTALTADLPPEITVADNETSRGLISTLAAERISGYTEDVPMNSDMFRGVVSEPFARNLYSTHYQQATEVGFMVRDFDGFQIGLSPDGLVGFNGGLEVKAPRQKTHVNWVLADEVPAQHCAQVQCALLVSGRDWWDFMSFVGGLPIFVKRATPDPMWQAAILAAAERAEVAITEIVSTYRERVNGLPVADRIPDLNGEIQVA